MENFDLKNETATCGNTVLPAVYYEYGGMKFKQRTKSHICDDNGKVLCGVKSHWMEAGEPINEQGFVRGMEHLYSLFDREHFTCQKCFKKWRKLNGRHNGSGLCDGLVFEKPSPNI